jgi:flavodoxin
MKTLVAYFSAEGTTAAVAKELAEKLGADIFEIRPVEPYSAADIKWTNPLARCNREKIGRKDVPVANTVADWAAYDTVYLGFPIWYYGAPNVVQTFCKAYDWQGKRVILFATSGGSDMGRTAEKLQPFVKNGQIIKAQVLRGTSGLEGLIL